MTMLRLATLWLDGCSGCHMSLLDTDERLLDLAAMYEFVHSPLVDSKHFPEAVDVVLIEGAVSSHEDVARLRLARRHARVLIAVGDCAVTGNVPALRNGTGAAAMLRTVYLDQPALNPQIPATDLPVLLERALPLHHFVTVDLFIPGCPPGAETLLTALTGLAAGTVPGPPLSTRFGA